MVDFRQKSINIRLVKRDIPPLSLTVKGKYSPPVISYFNYYGLDFDADHFFGTFTSQDYTLAAHVFIPENSLGTVFLLHGYYDHSGILKSIIRRFINNQFSVALFDFPGHGLSSGKPAAIDSFSEYVVAFRDFYNLCRPHITGPLYLIGHSTGCAVALEYLHQDDDVPFEKTILLAPLVRCSYFTLSRLGYTLVKPFFHNTPRWFRYASSDREFLRFFRNDPLQCRHFPVRWAHSYYTWEKQFKSVNTISAKVTVIQGTKDTTVDWQYNIPLIKRKIPVAKIVYINNARHQLMNEAKPLRDTFLTTLCEEVHQTTAAPKKDSPLSKIYPTFQKHGLDAMIKAYESNMRFPSYRLKQYVWQGITGIRFHHFLCRINDGLKNLSHNTMSEAAYTVLNRLSFSISVNRHIDLNHIKSSPIIFYAKHPSYIEPMACLAALKEFNPRVVATGWIKNLSKEAPQWIISSPDSKEAVFQELKRYTGIRRVLETLWAKILIFQVIKYLQGDMSAHECQKQRLSALSEILFTLEQNRAVLIFPSGGEGQKPWVKENTVNFEKLIRIIIKRQNKITELQNLLFIPVTINGPVRTLFQSNIMNPYHPITFLFRLLPKRPYEFEIRDRLSLKELLKKGSDSEDIVGELMSKLGG